MQRTMLRVKIHRAVVSEADLNYVGSMTIPAGLMKEFDIREGEQLDVVNINTGARWTTYAITGPKEGHFCLNGAAARLGAPGDRIIIMIYAHVDERELPQHRIRIAQMSDDNKVLRIDEM
ncbi:MAG: aspartate 1-decarboxylase [Planctomycetota bacterium]|nr:aspartate 1-decarboxylase [Planctomycetota bacterium]